MEATGHSEASEHSASLTAQPTEASNYSTSLTAQPAESLAAVQWRELGGISIAGAIAEADAHTGPVVVAELKALLEARVAADPGDYVALVCLGEVNLRIGLSRDAQALLYRASLMRPPSWEAYQRTSLLLRRAEEHAQKSFDRPSGARPPFAASVERVADRVRGLLASRNAERPL